MEQVVTFPSYVVTTVVTEPVVAPVLIPFNLQYSADSMIPAADVIAHMKTLDPLLSGDLMRVNLLLYYCQGLYWLLGGKRFIMELIVKYPDGPRLFGLTMDKIESCIKSALAIPQDKLDLISRVVHYFKAINTEDLQSRVLNEDPYLEAKYSVIGNYGSEILDDSLWKYFSTQKDLILAMIPTSSKPIPSNLTESDYTLTEGSSGTYVDPWGENQPRFIAGTHTVQLIHKYPVKVLSAIDVLGYLRSLDSTLLDLNKGFVMLYICNGIYHSITGKCLIEDKFLKSPTGPVLPQLDYLLTHKTDTLIHGDTEGEQQRFLSIVMKHFTNKPLSELKTQFLNGNGWNKLKVGNEVDFSTVNTYFTRLPVTTEIHLQFRPQDIANKTADIIESALQAGGVPQFIVPAVKENMHTGPVVVGVEGNGVSLSTSKSDLMKEWL